MANFDTWGQSWGTSWGQSWGRHSVKAVRGKGTLEDYQKRLRGEVRDKFEPVAKKVETVIDNTINELKAQNLKEEEMVVILDDRIRRLVAALYLIK